MTNGLAESFPAPSKMVIMVKHNMLPSVKLHVMHLFSPTPNSLLVHVKIIDGRLFMREREGGMEVEQKESPPLSPQAPCG